MHTGWAVAVTAVRLTAAWNTEVYTTLAVRSELDREEAIRIAYLIAEELYPRSDGWKYHHVANKLEMVLDTPR